MNAVSLRILPAAIGLILFATAVPLELRGAPLWVASPWVASDVLANVLLYMPLGWCMGRRSLIRIVVVSGLLSAAIELSQAWSFGRYPSIYDVMANAAGGVIGAMIARALASRGIAAASSIRVNGLVIAACVAGAVLPPLLWVGHRASNPLMTWDAGYELLLANEYTGDRPWRGTLDKLVLLPKSLSGPQVLALGDLATTASADVEKSAAYVLPTPVESASGTAVSLPREAGQRFAQLARESGSFSVLARVRTDNVSQAGPARIVTYSIDQYHRNFDLGQEGRAFVFRVRTPETGLNGNDGAVQTERRLEPDRGTTVIATFDGAVARVYVNDRLEGRGNLAAGQCRVASLCDTHLPLARAIVGACAAVVALVLLAPHARSRARVLAISAGVGAVAAAVIHGIDVSAPPHLLAQWTALLAIPGALCAGAAMDY